MKYQNQANQSAHRQTNDRRPESRIDRCAQGIERVRERDAALGPQRAMPAAAGQQRRDETKANVEEVHRMGEDQSAQKRRSGPGCQTR